MTVAIDPVASGMSVSVEQGPMAQVGPSASLSDITGFQGSLSAAGGIPQIGSPDALAPALKAVMGQVEQVNGEAKSVAEFAKAAEASGKEMTPGEVVNLTMKCHEFMFHCQLTSSIANRTSDGIQQLFRQQS